jgi:hypothetical protein
MLRFFLVTKSSAEEGEIHWYGDFVVDTPFDSQAEILDSLTDEDANQIGVRLGIIPNLESDIPFDVNYTLGPIPESPEHVSASPSVRRDYPRQTRHQQESEASFGKQEANHLRSRREQPTTSSHHPD